jgi:flagellar FliJ protein
MLRSAHQRVSSLDSRKSTIQKDTMPKFKLESLLQHRKHVEDVFQRELADTLKLLEEEKRALMQMVTNRGHIEEDLKQRLEHDLAAAEMLSFHKYLDRLALDITVQKARVSEAEKRFEQKRLSLTEAVKDRKIMDKLKEKQLAAETERMQKQEQGFMNEVAINRHLRSR